MRLIEIDRDLVKENAGPVRDRRWTLAVSKLIRFDHGHEPDPWVLGAETRTVPAVDCCTRARRMSGMAVVPHGGVVIDKILKRPGYHALHITGLRL